MCIRPEMKRNETPSAGIVAWECTRLMRLKKRKRGRAEEWKRKKKKGLEQSLRRNDAEYQHLVRQDATVTRYVSIGIMFRIERAVPVKGEIDVHGRRILTNTMVRRGAVVHRQRILAECKGLRAEQFGSLLDFTQTSLTRVGVLLSCHLNIILRRAPCSMILKERAVPTVQNVCLWVGKPRILICVHGSVSVANELGHDGSAVRRVFAVEDQQRFLGRLQFKQLF